MEFYKKLLGDATSHHSQLIDEQECLQNQESMDNIQKQGILSRLQLLHDYLLHRSCDPTLQIVQAQVQYDANIQDLEYSVVDTSRFVEAKIRVKSPLEECLVMEVMGPYDTLNQASSWKLRNLSQKNGLRLEDATQVAEIAKMMYEDQVKELK